MAIELDAYIRLHEPTVRNSAQNAQRYFERAGANVGQGFDRGMSTAFTNIERGANRSATAVQRSYQQASTAFNRAADAAGRVRIETERYNAVMADTNRTQLDAVRASERLASAKRAEQQAVSRAASAHSDYDGHLRRLSGAFDTAASSGAGLMGTITQLGQGIASLGRIGGPVAIATLAVGLTQLAGVAATAAGSLWALPGAVGAVGAAFGTIKLATSGMEDAFTNMGDPEKFAESLAKLSPSAQQFVLTIQNMMPQLRELRQATQGAFFEGLGPQLSQLADTFLPMIQRMTTGVAGALNQMMSGVATQLMTPGTAGAIDTFLANVTSAFQQLAPAAAPLTQALGDIMAVGSGVFPDLASAAADAARSFAAFISEARQSGDLQRWLEQGMAALGAIKDIAWDVGRAFMALAPVGSEILPTIVTAFDVLANVMPVLVEGAGAFLEVVRLVSGDMSALPDLFGRIGDWGVSAFNSVRDALDRMFDPVRAGIELFNQIPGVLDIPQIPSFGAGASSAPGVSRGGIDGVHGTGPGGMPSTAPGSLPFPTPTTGLAQSGWSGTPYADLDPFGPIRDLRARLGTPATSGGRGGGSSAKTPEGLVPNAAQLQDVLQRMFPGVQVNADVGRQDSYGEHSSGEALDIMVGQNRQLGEQINRWLLANSDAFGLQYNLWRRASWDPSGEIRPMEDRGSPTANHMDHIHARVSPGERASGNYMPLGATPYQSGILGGNEVTVRDFGSSARSDLNGAMGQVGAKLDDDLGLSRGLPGLAENAVRFVGNLFFAPLLTALQVLAGGRPNEGSGLIGMLSAGRGGGGAAGTPAAGASAGYASFAPNASAMGPAALQPPTQWSADWNAIAQKESSGDWGINTGNGYSGGLQFSPSSWEAAGGNKYAPSAHLATPYQQALTAEQLLQMQGPGAWPNTFVPGNSGPAAPGAGAGGLFGAPAAPTPSGLGPAPLGGGLGPGLVPPGPGAPGAAPNSQLPSQQPGAGPGGGGAAGLGGIPLAALNTAVSSLDMLAPGAGAAAQTGIQLVNRAIGAMGQYAAVGVGGLLETFLPNGGSALADQSKGWIGRIAAGVAGAKVSSAPNTAGQAAPPDKKQQGPEAAKQGGRDARGAMVEIKEMHNHGSDGQGVANDIARVQMASAAAGARR